MSPARSLLLVSVFAGACQGASKVTPPGSTDDTGSVPTGDTGTGACRVSDPALDLSAVGVELELDGDQVLELCSEGGEWLRVSARADDWDARSPTLQLLDPDGVPFGPSFPVEGPSPTNHSQVRYLHSYLPTAGHWTVRATEATGFDIAREAMPEGSEPDSMSGPGLSIADLPIGFGPDGSPPLWGSVYEGFAVVPVALDLGDEDWVAIPNVASGGPVEIWGPAGTTASDLAVRVTLYDPAGTEVAAVGDLGLDNRISLWGAVAGDYTMKVTSTDGSEGWNLLYVRTWPQHFAQGAILETEPNDSQAQAELVTFGGGSYTSYADRSGVIGDATDEDWLRVDGAAGWDLYVGCRDELFGGTAVVAVEALDASGVPLPVLERVSFGTYYEMTEDSAWVRVSGASGRFGDTAFYGCSITASESLHYGTTSE